MTLVASATPSFTNITQDDYNSITKEFSANFTHSSVTGAATLGKIFGIELAFVGGSTASPNISSIVQRSGGSAVTSLYHGGFLIGASVPFGISAELLTIPKTSSSGASFQLSSMAVKWTMDEVFTVIPFNLAMRGIYSTSQFSFTQNISGIDSTVSNSNSVTGLQLLASPKLPFLEPYVGIGILQAKNTLSVSGTSGTIFDSTLTLGQSSDNTASATELLAGLNAKLIGLSLGIEYANLFGTSRYNAKLGFAF
jgi:hypothetical protein